MNGADHGAPPPTAGDACLYVNGKRYTLLPGLAESTLLQWLRCKCGFHTQSGAHPACVITRACVCPFMLNIELETLSPPAIAAQGLTGTKLGCGEGGCGACTVLVSSAEPDGSLWHRSVNACLCPVYSVEGMHVVTVEGIGNARDGLHPVQERLAKAHGSQCGFCTPGFVMSM